MTARPAQGAAVEREGMAWVPGGKFRMGSDHHYPEEAPAHKVAVDGFWMDRITVTNREFSRFVDATGYVTLAERPVDPADYPDARPELLVPSSVMFHKASGPVDLRNPYNWWVYTPGADWRHPRGPSSNLDQLGDHPVVHVAFEDAEAYSRWAGKELPTEAEWEHAARGGLEGAEFVWGDELNPGGKAMANFWQGEFPWQNLLSDGFEWTAPVGTFPANGYGLHEMAGNVWEWTTDWYQEHGRIASSPLTSCTQPERRPGRPRPAGGHRGDSHLPHPLPRPRHGAADRAQRGRLIRRLRHLDLLSASPS